jgi:hypothetical protein
MYQFLVFVLHDFRSNSAIANQIWQGAKDFTDLFFNVCKFCPDSAGVNTSLLHQCKASDTVDETIVTLQTQLVSMWYDKCLRTASTKGELLDMIVAQGA